MAALILPQELTVEQKLHAMENDAAYEACGDSDAEAAALFSAGQIKAPSYIPKALRVQKTFLSNNCSFNCSYCGCRCGRDGANRYAYTPSQLAALSVDAALSAGRGSVFVTSAVYKNADYTQELLAETVRIMRRDMGYGGFIHAKVMPGADPVLIERTGLYADRLSVNIEVAKSEGYSRIAKQKNKSNILKPMGEIASRIAGAGTERRRFATSQTTQLMAGSTGEDDRTIVTLADALYRKYRLKRVYYTSYTYAGGAKGYEQEELQSTKTPLWRTARLYQADRLMALYGFTPDELTPEGSPFLEPDIDPKTAWALRHLDMFPVEVSTADYDTLIRVPGIGVTGAKRIIAARRYSRVTHEMLGKMRIPVSRARIFITCGGIYRGGNVLFSPFLRQGLSNGGAQLSITASLYDGAAPTCCI